MATSHVIIVSASKSKAIVLYICFCGTHINEPNVVRQLKPKPHCHQKVYYTPSQNIWKLWHMLLALTTAQIKAL